jgi:hypothetical protein
MHEQTVTPEVQSYGAPPGFSVKLNLGRFYIPRKKQEDCLRKTLTLNRHNHEIPCLANPGKDDEIVG